MEAIISAFFLLIIGATIVPLSSGKVISQGSEALVERLGKYQRTLKPGLNFIVPFLDTIVWEETTREQVLDIEPQDAITSDNVSLKADAVVYWQILNMQRAYYAIDDVEKAIETLVLTTLRSEIGQMKLEETYSSRKEINQKLLHQLDEATESWGVKVTRVEVKDIKPAPKVLQSMEEQRAAEIRKRAAILDAEGTAEYMEKISQALQKQTHGQEVLQFFLAQKYVEANTKLGESKNSKILFMNPAVLNEALAELLKTDKNAGKIQEIDDDFV